jgi:hypothetical protein
MKMNCADWKRLATGLAGVFLCQCELPDAEYFAQKWEEPRVVFDPPKWQLAQAPAEGPRLDESEFPPVPYMSPELPLVDGGARLTPPVADSRVASLLPALPQNLAGDRDFDVVAIPEWKAEEVKTAQVVTAEKKAEPMKSSGVVLGLPPPPLPKASPTDDEAGKSVAKAVVPTLAEEEKAETKLKTGPAGVATSSDRELLTTAEAKKTEKSQSAEEIADVQGEKVKVVGAAPGLALTKPPAAASLGDELVTGLAGKGAAELNEAGGAKMEPKESAAAAAVASLLLPEGLPMAGRPGLVRSPYGQAHQLVDVSDLKVGDLVKCPFSGKAFRVPRMDATGSAAEVVPEKGKKPQ